MTRNMGAFDRGLRAFIVAPVAIVVALLVGASTVFGVILFVVRDEATTHTRCFAATSSSARAR